MDVIKNFTKRSMGRNKKRTIVTIIGVMLSAALMCAVAGMAATFRDGMINYYETYYGSFYGRMANVPMDKLSLVTDNAHVVRAGVSMPVGTALIDEAGAYQNKYLDEPYIELRAFNDAAFEDVSLNVISGRLPENDTELLVNEKLMPETWKVGDKITLNLGHRVLFGEDVACNGVYLSREELEDELGISADGENDGDESGVLEDAGNNEIYRDTFGEQVVDKKPCEYTIVGIMKDPNDMVQVYGTGGCVCLTRMEDTGIFSAYRDTDAFTANVYFTYDNARNYGDYTDEITKKISSGNADNHHDNMGYVDGDTDYNGDTAGYVADNMERLRPGVSTVKNDLVKFLGGLGDVAATVVEALAGIIIAIIVITSVFVISNSFRISVAEKKIQFGMLSSVGATKRQIKKIVLKEGMYIWVAGTALGILLGVFVVAVLTAIVQRLVGDVLKVDFRFVFPWWVSVIVILMSAVTIYFACIIPAKAAAKISPIEAIRGNQEIRLKGRKLKTSGITRKMFGIGGVIAAKNLKRSRRSYRTTVVSLVIGVATFIAVSSFIGFGMDISEYMYEDSKCDIVVDDVGGTPEEMAKHYQEYKKLASLDGVKECTMLRLANATISKDYIDEKVVREYSEEGYDDNEWYGSFVVYDREYFARFLDEIGVKADDLSKVAILEDDYLTMRSDNSYERNRYLNVNKGDTVPIKVYGEKDSEVSGGSMDKGAVDTDAPLFNIDVKITEISDERPVGLVGRNWYPEAYIIVCEDYFDQDVLLTVNGLYINTDTPDELCEAINDVLENDGMRSDFYVQNIAEDREQMRRIILMISIFLYGFIIVTTLIGVTNIFNTIHTNMNLRAREFAMLKSVGMTGREFNRMIRLESIMYGSKSLVIGLPLGVILSYAIYKTISKEIELGYNIPVMALLIAVVFVMIIVWMTMHLSLSKIKGQNIIETIRKQTY